MDCLQSQRRRCPSGWRTGIGRRPLMDGMDVTQLPPGPVLTVWNWTLFFKFSVSLCGEFFPSFPASIEALAALAGKVQLGAAPSTKLLFNLMSWVFSFGEGCGWVGDVMYSLHLVFALFMKLHHKLMILLLWREAGETKGRWHLGGSHPHTSFRKQLVPVWLFLFRFNFKPKFYC